MDWQLDGKRVLVTGASSGIGAAIVQAFAEAGAHIGVHYNRNRDGADEVARQARQEGVEAVMVHADVTDPEGPGQAVRTANDELGGLDVLVNNAGGLGGRQAVEEMDDEFLERVTSLNYYSTVRASRTAVPLLRDGGGGAIVNMSSIAASSGGGPGSSAYCASKAAVVAFTRALAKETAGSGIRVNALSPGVIDTPFHTPHTTREMMEAMVSQIPLGRVGSAGECAGAALYFASPATGSFVTGQVLEINGGHLFR